MKENDQKCREEKVEELITVLAPEIECKCMELKTERKHAVQEKLFLLLCAAVVIIPTVFAFCGFSMAAFLIPAIFTAVACLILSPILLTQQGGYTYEQV